MNSNSEYSSHENNYTETPKLKHLQNECLHIDSLRWALRMPESLMHMQLFQDNFYQNLI